MADYRIQLKDKEGNRQFPVTTTQSIVDSEGRSLEEILANLGDGNEDIGGLKYVEERTFYPNKMRFEGTDYDFAEISESERAYNTETLRKALNDEYFILTGYGTLYQLFYINSDQYAVFGTIGETGEGVVSNTVTINQEGDAIIEQKVLELGGCITFYKGDWTIEERLTVEQKAHNASMFQLYKTSPYAIGVFVDRSEELSIANGLSGRALKVSIPAQAQYLPIEAGTEAIMLKEDLFNDDEIAMVILNDGSVYGANELE